MIRKFYVFYVLFIFQIPHAASIPVDRQLQDIQKKVSMLANIDKMATQVSQSMLPSPYDYLLTQPLMTIGIEKYYQRTPIIQTIYAKKNQYDNTYYRAVIMLLDHNKTRNNVALAQKKKEIMVVELAFITMNFNELPKKVIADVLNTNIPFGTLLLKNHIKTLSTSRSYFSVKCNEILSSVTHCNLNSQVCDRTSTLTRTDNNQWIAHVVEILPGFLR
ncbi:hypothetical protein [Legionella sp.]|uniref:hypothetical protein n=1 Tax=Legionella sp. TaxID=459 RepID=UPI003CBE8E01